MKKLTVINGDLAKEIVKGAKIINVTFTGYDFYVLVELPKGGEWQYAQFETTTFHQGDAIFHLMVRRNGTKKQVQNKFSIDAWETKVAHDKAIELGNCIYDLTKIDLISE